MLLVAGNINWKVKVMCCCFLWLSMEGKGGEGKGIWRGRERHREPVCVTDMIYSSWSLCHETVVNNQRAHLHISSKVHGSIYSHNEDLGPRYWCCGSWVWSYPSFFIFLDSNHIIILGRRRHFSTEMLIWITQWQFLLRNYKVLWCLSCLSGFLLSFLS